MSKHCLLGFILLAGCGNVLAAGEERAIEDVLQAYEQAWSGHDA